MAIDARVHPAVPVDRSRLLVTLGVFERVFLAVRRYWNSIQVGHRGRYSAERLLAFQEYYQRTSPGRAFMVCFLAVLPPFVVAILAEFIPLRPPHEGWKANYMYWISLFVSSLPISTGGVYQVREIIEPGTISMTGVVVTAVRSCTVNVVLTMILAVLWEFPVPFGYVMTVVGPFIGSYMILFLLSVGPRVLASSPMLHRQIFTQMLVIAAQGTLAIAYPTFGAIFNQLSIIGQTVFIFVLPMIKFSIKQFIANTSAHLHEYVGPTVVLSVDVCNVLYVAICVQTAVSPLTSGLQIASDAFFVVMGLRSIYHQSEVSQARQRLISMNSNLPPTLNYIRNLRALLREAFQSPRASERVPIRIRAPFPLPLSDESKAFMEELEHVRRRCSVETEFGKDMRLESITTGSFHARSHYNEWREPSDILSSPKAILVNSSHDYMVTHSTQLTASGTAFDRPILAHQEPSAAPTVNSFPQSKRSRMSGTVGPYHLEVVTSNVQDSLQALFHSEYVVLAEFIECVIPVLYGIYLAFLYHLPTAAYYPHTRSLTPEKFANTELNIMLYAAVEFFSFIGVNLLLQRKFGFSPLYQLAFVCEIHSRTILSYLFVWITYILPITLDHNGVDLEAPFE